MPMPMPMHSLQKTSIIGVEVNRYQSAEIDTKAQNKTDNKAPALQQQQQRGKSGRRIHFNTRVAVKETIHVNDYTDEELFNAWYKKADFSKMKASYAVIVQLLASGQYKGDTDEMTSRGLEYRHREGATKRKANKLNALYAVLDEQERQWNAGYDNDETLRNVYLQHSTHCRHAAHAMGQKDEDQCKMINRAVIQDHDDEMSVDSDDSDESMDLVHHSMETVTKSNNSKQKSKFSRFFHKKDGTKSGS